MKNLFTVPLYVGIILEQHNQYLLVQRCNTDWMSGSWNFPGGLVEDGESLIEAAAREAREEVGVIIEPSRLSLVHVLQIYKNEHNTKNIIGFYFKAQHWQGTPENKEPHKHTDIAWFSLNALPNAITEHAVQAIKGMQAEVLFSEHGRS